MLESKTIYAGNSVDLARVGHILSDGSLADLSVGYTCQVKVFGTGIDRAVTTLVADEQGNANRYFLVGLASSETTGLAVDSYPYAVTIEKAAAGFKQTDEATLTVEPLPGAELSEADQLRAELAQVRAGRIALMTGGVVAKVRNGRYATEMWYATASLDDYNKMIAALESEIAAAERIADGGKRRSVVAIPVWSN